MSDGLDRAGRSALHYAALDGDLDEVARLIADGFDVGLPDKAGFTPLHFAAQGRHAGVAEALLAAGAPVDPQDRFGKTPLLVGLLRVRDDESERAVVVLLAAGADPDLENHYGISPRGHAESVTNYDLMRFFR